MGKEADGIDAIMRGAITFMMAYITIAIIWQTIELLLYGHTNPNTTDTIIAAELALIVVLAKETR